MYYFVMYFTLNLLVSDSKRSLFPYQIKSVHVLFIEILNLFQICTKTALIWILQGSLQMSTLVYIQTANICKTNRPTLLSKYRTLSIETMNSS